MSKIRRGLLGAAILAAGVMMLVSCSHVPHHVYATGHYRCYFKNVHTGKYYHGVSPYRNMAIRRAEDACGSQGMKKRCVYRYCRYA